ncbi:hypothetical protein N7475_000930 [Penicillium sp. IBT 31633x]|nr:hypothetical protein N7475_000930 [Penicillium sp. IBT 31633x]
MLFAIKKTSQTIVLQEKVGIRSCFQTCEFRHNKSPWRNWLARLTVNQEVGSSSLPGDVLFVFVKLILASSDEFLLR